jgi:WhiB family transcriptional regulator, redox-sensing transcriptional regulator
MQHGTPSAYNSCSCPECRVAILNKRRRQLNEKRAESATTVTCDDCGTVLASPTGLAIHRTLMHVEVECPICGDRYTPRGLPHHLARGHKISNPDVAERVLDQPMPQPVVEQIFPVDWQDHAECRGAHGVFFPGRGEDTRALKAICASCPVRECCLDHALANGEKWGVWGGTSERERRRIRKTRRLAEAS